METYKAMKKRHQQEVNEFPFGFAFTDDRFEAVMKEWGLDPEKDTDKVVDLGAGAFIQVKDYERMKEMFRRQKNEREDAISADKTGDGYIYQMFLYELKNHEYGYTGDSDDTVYSLGLTYEKIEDNPALSHGFKKAKDKIWAEEW